MKPDLLNLEKGFVCYQIRHKKRKISYLKIILDNVIKGGLITSYYFRRSDKTKPSIFLSVSSFNHAEQTFELKGIYLTKKDLFVECYKNHYNELSNNLKFEIDTFIKKHPQYFI